MLRTAIVLDGNQRSALATVRALGRLRVPVIVADTQPRTLAASSAFCRASLVYPDPAHDPGGFVQWLGELDRQHPEAVLMPMTDLTVPLVLRAGSRLGSLRTALPSLKAYETASDKLQLFELARSLGVRAPHTTVVSRRNVAGLGDLGLNFPVVVKPRLSATRRASGILKRPVQYAADARHLTDIVQRDLLDDDDELLVQQHIQGFGAGVFALYEHGAARFFFAHKRIREKPPSGGVSVVCESTPLTPENVDLARRLLDALAWHGVAMVELKIDEAGRPWLIEINARFWGSLQLAVDCGARFPEYIYCLAAEQPCEIPRRYAIGRRLRWWLGDLDHLYLSLRDPEHTPTLVHKLVALGRFVLPWQPGLRYEFARLSDPAPAVYALQEYLRQLLVRNRR